MISKLAKRSGFFSTFFFTINHYLYCKKNKIKLTINCDDWFFKYIHGWTDYFKSIDLDYENDVNKVVGHGNVLEKFKIQEYKDIIPEIWIYNDFVKTQCELAYQKLNLKKGEYSAIFIRRGDKLIYESKLIEANEYLDILLEKDPDCKQIFLQTDDYNSFLELKEIIGQDKEICTLCDPNQFGITMGQNLNSTRIEKNKNYVKQLSKSNNKPISQMNPEEIRDHTLTMLIGLDIVLNSKYCITDYQSNVSRFIKLAHPYYNNVFDVYGFDIKLDECICPAYENSVYDDIEEFRNS